jgi:outer membrane protein assembly factor BamB
MLSTTGVHTVFRPTPPPVRRLILSIFLVAVVAPALAGCRSTQRDDKAVAAPVGSLVQSWKLPLELSSQGDSIRGLYLREDVLFAYSQNNRVVAIVADTGKILFGADVTPGSIPLKPPILMKDRYCFPDGSTIECYDRKTGKLLDSVETDRSIRSPGAQSGNTIYVGLDYPGGGRLSAIDLTRKFDRSRWQALTFGGISAKPAVFQNVVYLGSEDGRVYAVNESDRAPVWPLERSAFQTDGKVIGDLYADETGLYVASTDAKLYCLELGTGKIKWQYFAAAPLEEGAVVTDDSVYVMVPRVGVAVLTKTEGKYNREARFVAKGTDRFLAQDDKHVYLKTTDNYVAAYDKQTGELKFKSNRRDLIALAVNTKDSTIYGATRDGLVLCIKPVTKPGTVGTLVAAPARDDAAVASAR